MFIPANRVAAVKSDSLHTRFDITPRTLNELLLLPIDQHDAVDIARMNLLCATGLAGAESLDIDHAVATIDHWAQRVAFETERHLYRVTDSRYAAHYRHSEAYLRAEFLVQVLMEDLGVKYDLTAKDNFAFNDSRVAFIHGMIPSRGRRLSDTSGGTCASMPVLYIAVGRRLGYPLNLVATSGHLFCRWDGQIGKGHPNPAWRVRFNIDGAGAGFSSHSDDYYKTWPIKLTDSMVRTGRYLLSLSATEMFAAFLGLRAACGRDNGQHAFAARCCENAYGYDSARPSYCGWFIEAALRSGYQPTHPDLVALLAAEKRRSPVGYHPSRPRHQPLNHPNGFAGPHNPTPGFGLPQQPFSSFGVPQSSMPSIHPTVPTHTMHPHRPRPM